MRRIWIGVIAIVIASAGCVGRIGTSASSEGMDGGIVLGHDGGMPGHDAWSQPGTVAWSQPGTDAWSPPRPDAWSPPPPDAWSPPPPDAWIDPTCSSGAPLTAPIAGCMPMTPASTGDPHADCVIRINQLRCQCQHLPPLMRWTAGEACADQMAMYDQMQMTAHAGFRAGICPFGGNGENECPGWLGWHDIPSTVSGCLQQMWDEGPGPFFGPPQHGHYINMSSTSFTMVACGFYSSGGQVTAVQNFQ